MAYAYSDLVARAQSWVRQALEKQRLDPDQAGAILTIDARTPDNLFSEVNGRPLIVAFMGGTGVGKSTLLNRLAGQAVARTGIERPTSREVTLYHHESVSIDRLPAGLPLDKIQVSRHRDDEKSNIIWVDMPDFDSVELNNKHLVLEWLPHIDVLLYVVSPERYRDNKAWRLLLAEGARHAWLFVLNQWDRGQPEQYKDFKQQLSKAGFEDPLVYRTICSDTAEQDEFHELVAELLRLSKGHSVRELEQRGREVRMRQLLDVLRDFQGRYAAPDYAELIDSYKRQWRKTERVLSDGFEWPLTKIAAAYADKGGGRPEIELWDDWAQSRYDDLLDGIVGKAAELNMPVKPLKNALAPLKESAGKIIATQTELACRQALIHPGNAVQRFFIKLMRIAEFALPLAAMSLVGYMVVTGFYHSAQTGEHFLGTDFAIHSVLLIGLSWLVPYFLHKKMQPSLQKTALDGLNKGLAAAFVHVDAEIAEVLEKDRRNQERLVGELGQLVETVRESAGSGPSPRKDRHLDRMLIE